jgi:hypothetical protein
MLRKEMPLNFVQKIAIQVNQGAALFAFKMKVPPADFVLVDILITGAFTVL